jgi:hypothetical protein
LALSSRPFAALFRHYGVGGVITMLVGLLSIEFILVLIFGIEPKTAASKKSPEIDFKGSACSAWPPPQPVNTCFSLVCSPT